MKFSESELRKLIREELDGKKNPLAQTNQLLPPREDSETRLKASPNRGPAESGPLDLSSVIDLVDAVTEQVSTLLLNSTQSTENEWTNMEVSNRISNRIMKAIRLEVNLITRELEMEDKDFGEW